MTVPTAPQNNGAPKMPRSGKHSEIWQPQRADICVEQVSALLLCTGCTARGNLSANDFRTRERN